VRKCGRVTGAGRQSGGTDKSRRITSLGGIAERTGHYPVQLSGGEQQRVALARAFANQPSVLLADEPTGNLDSATGRQIIELLIGLNRDHGSTMVLVTHDPELAARADRVVTLQDGRVVSDDLRNSTEASLP